jgi:phosphoenolpyruvate carboxykinase (ATP)
MYHFISGYTAKVAGTEVGISEPQVTFSACFGAAFLVMHPMRYAELLATQIQKHGSSVWLVNTGWSGGAYGTGKRISLKHTRAIIDAIHNGSLLNSEYETDLIFGLSVPKWCTGVPSKTLRPRECWHDVQAYEATAQKLAKRFSENFSLYADEASAEVIAAGPSGK